MNDKRSIRGGPEKIGNEAKAGGDLAFKVFLGGFFEFAASGKREIMGMAAPLAKEWQVRQSSGTRVGCKLPTRAPSELLRPGRNETVQYCSLSAACPNRPAEKFIPRTNGHIK
jgi:hypothetical protein